MYFPAISAILNIVGFNTDWHFLVFVALVPLFFFFLKKTFGGC